MYNGEVSNTFLLKQHANENSQGNFTEDSLKLSVNFQLHLQPHFYLWIHIYLPLLCAGCQVCSLYSMCLFELRKWHNVISFKGVCMHC